MRAGRSLLVLVAVSTVSAPALAADWYTGAPGFETQQPAQSSFISFFDASNTTPQWTKSAAPVVTEPYSPPAKFGVAIDASLTADTKGSRFATVIGTIAPFSDFDQSGLRLKVAGVIGSYGYTNSTVGHINGTQHAGSFMIGYEWVTPKASFGLYGGADYSNNKLDKFDVNNKSVGEATGAKIAVDFNYRPTAYTMFSGTASFSSAHNAYYARLKGGYAIAQGTYVGPEAIFMGDDFFQQWRVGGHVTGATFGMLSLGASAGILVDKVRGTGMYGIVDARVGF